MYILTSGDAAVAANAYPYYFLIDIEGLNKSDEAAVAASKSTFSRWILC
jgi:hypothetical protein